MTCSLLPAHPPALLPAGACPPLPLQGSRTGRLLAYYPSTHQTRVLANGFWYANGVALSPDESFVALVETNRLRVNRFWLKGPKVRHWARGLMGWGL